MTLLVGCGNDDDGSASGSNSNSQSGTGDSEPTDSATEPTGGASNSGSSTGNEGGMSDSLSGTTGAEGGMSDSLSGTVSSGVESDSMSGTSNTTTMGEGGGESTGSSGETTGAPIDCTTLDNEADCVAAGCMAIVGSKFFIDDANACLEQPSFLACAEQAACPEVITTVCKGDPNKNKYQLPNGCAPPDFEPCTPPPDAGMDGYSECP